MRERIALPMRWDGVKAEVVAAVQAMAKKDATQILILIYLLEY